ncbi:MAG: RNA polymerase sigma factor [Planctomycetia bacterium]|nr:RNA polymerase sigma factor [Planctomycetia bacterium]
MVSRFGGFGLKTWITLVLPGAIAYASSLVGDRAHGEDIVQDCVCRLLGHAARYDLPRDGRKLLFRAITNACINCRTRNRKMLSLDQHGRSPDGGAWEVEDVAASAPPVMAMAEELRSAIADGLQTLPMRHRSALELSSLGYRSDEIAEMLTVQPDNVRVILFRARKAMATFLNARFSGGVAP